MLKHTLFPRSDEIQQHEQEVSLFIAQRQAKISGETFKQYGIDSNKYWGNVSKFCEKWYGHVAWGDIPERRLANEILSDNLFYNPLTMAILSDSAGAFTIIKENISTITKWSPIYWLEVACLCGASSVVEKMLQFPEYVNALTHSKNVVAFAQSSGNVELAKKVNHISTSKQIS